MTVAINRVAIVTGANKGIGLAIVRQLALQYSKSTLSASGGSFLIYLTARSAERGTEAVKFLENDAQLRNSKVLVNEGGPTTIKCRELDIGKAESIHKLTGYVKSQYPEGIDIVINNAGIALTGFDANVVRETLHTNYHGTLDITQELLPCLRTGGRLVNIASSSGHLDKYSPDIRQKFQTASQTSLAACTELMDSFTSSVIAGTEVKDGWPSAAYAVSKAGVIAISKVFDMEARKTRSSVRVEVCCPGYVNTDMTRGKGTKTPDKGATTPAQLGLKIIGVEEGKIVEGFWKNEKVIEW